MVVFFQPLGDHWTIGPGPKQVGRSSERYGTTESTEKRPKGLVKRFLVGFEGFSWVPLLELKHMGLDRNCIIERG